MALDVKVINALGAGHFDETLGGPLKAAEAYRAQAMEHQQTAQRCEAQGIRFEPLVFTAQGGCESHAESILSQIADAVAKQEDLDAGVVKADMLERISFSLARSCATTITRRASRATYSCAARRRLEDLSMADVDEGMF